ncbi:MAG: glycosyltransferase family 25 protein [Ferruginibacter sp.]
MPLPASTISFLQDYFDRIFVLSVPRFTERHKTVAEKLQGLQFDFFWGTDKLSLNMETSKTDGTYNEAAAVKLQRQGKALNSGELACSLSHRSIYYEMIKHNWHRVLILEDDIVPVEKTLDLLPDAIGELPENWELVYLGYLKNETVSAGKKLKQFFYKILSALGLMKWSYTMVSNMLPKAYSPYLKKAGFHDCTHAYAITLNGAQKLFAAQSPVVYRADDLLSHIILQGKLRAFVTEPKFFDQEIFYNSKNASEIR